MGCNYGLLYPKLCIGVKFTCIEIGKIPYSSKVLTHLTNSGGRRAEVTRIRGHPQPQRATTAAMIIHVIGDKRYHLILLRSGVYQLTFSSRLILFRLVKARWCIEMTA